MKTWSCQQRADCCRTVPNVVMTLAERDAVVAETRTLDPPPSLQWTAHPDPRFVSLQAGPCPLLAGRVCRIHPVRPYNCRRFGCLREGDEPYDLQQTAVKILTDRPSRRWYATNQRRAQRWAVAHGWTPS